MAEVNGLDEQRQRIWVTQKELWARLAALPAPGLSRSVVGRADVSPLAME